MYYVCHDVRFFPCVWRRTCGYRGCGTGEKCTGIGNHGCGTGADYVSVLLTFSKVGRKEVRDVVIGLIAKKKGKEEWKEFVIRFAGLAVIAWVVIAVVDRLG